MNKRKNEGTEDKNEQMLIFVTHLIKPISDLVTAQQYRTILVNATTTPDTIRFDHFSFPLHPILRSIVYFKRYSLFSLSLVFFSEPSDSRLNAFFISIW